MRRDLFSHLSALGILLSAVVMGCSSTPSAEDAAPAVATSEGDEAAPPSSASEPECVDINDCEAGAFACHQGRCQVAEASTCAELGLGATCSFESRLDGVRYEGRCAFHGGKGGYLCAPDCTETPCLQDSAICHPLRPTGQSNASKGCIAPCEETFECLGGAWECNSVGECVLPNEAACVGKFTLDPCTFEGSDGRTYDGICSTPPPTLNGPPYYSDTNLCVTLCDLDDATTCDRFLGVCQSAEAHGAGSHPEGRDYAVCVAPVCDGDEDCPGGMFGCDAATCVVPSFKACEGKETGASCVRSVGGQDIEGFCASMGLCMPACEPDRDRGAGTCSTNPSSTRCIAMPMPDGSQQGLCVPGF